MLMLKKSFFDKDAIALAKALLGKILRVRHGSVWLSALIIETEAYYKVEKGSHSSLGYTEKRKALFMPAGTIYMYYSHGGDSLNVSARGEGNAVLIKSGLPYIDKKNDDTTSNKMIKIMQQLNPTRQNHLRPIEKLCAGQTLLCKSLGLKVPEWDQRQFDPERFFIEDIDYNPEKIVQTRRLGIPKGRDEHLHYRFIDYKYSQYCTDNPLNKRKWKEGEDYFIAH